MNRHTRINRDEPRRPVELSCGPICRLRDEGPYRQRPLYLSSFDNLFCHGQHVGLPQP